MCPYYSTTIDREGELICYCCRNDESEETEYCYVYGDELACDKEPVEGVK